MLPSPAAALGKVDSVPCPGCTLEMILLMRVICPENMFGICDPNPHLPCIRVVRERWPLSQALMAFGGRESRPGGHENGTAGIPSPAAACGRADPSPHRGGTVKLILLAVVQVGLPWLWEVYPIYTSPASVMRAGPAPGLGKVVGLTVVGECEQDTGHESMRTGPSPCCLLH